MYIIINGIKYKFKMFSSGLKITRDIHENNSKTDGYLVMQDLILDKHISNVYKLSFSYENNSINIDFIKIFVSRKKNFTSLRVYVENIFELHKKFIIFFNKFNLNRILHCFQLPYICNLKCPYCAEYKKNIFYRNDLFPSINDILLEISINKKYIKGYNTGKISSRFMGGETLIDMDEFIYNVDFYKNKIDSNNEIQIYTNGTIKNSIYNFYNYVRKNTNFKKIDLWITIDSLDITKSNRIKEKKLMDNFINNLIYLKTIKDTRLKISFNIMYINDYETKKVISFLNKNGFNYFKIATDDTNKKNNYHKEIRVKKHNLMKKFAFSLGMKLSKNEMTYILPYHFCITNGNNSLYVDKISYNIPFNVVKIFSHNNTNI